MRAKGGENLTVVKVLNEFGQHFDSTFLCSLLLSKVLTTMGSKASHFCLKIALFVEMCCFIFT